MSYFQCFIVFHLSAAIWLTTHFVIFSGLYLLVSQQWCRLFLLGLMLVILGYCRFPKSQRAIDFFMPAFREGFGGVTIIRNDLNSISKPRLYAIHPHAILANGLGMAMHDCVSRGERITVVASSVLYWLNPIFRLFVNSMGCGISSVVKRDLERVMRSGDSIAIVPGGFEEVMLMEDGRDVVYLKRRIGFIRVCERFKYDIVPVLVFGESLLYRNRIPLTHFLARISAKLKMALVLPVGKCWWNFMPADLPKGMLVVFGQPISSGGDCNILHHKYMENLKEMHRRYNPYPSSKLKLI